MATMGNSWLGQNAYCIVTFFWIISLKDFLSEQQKHNFGFFYNDKFYFELQCFTAEIFLSC